MTDTTGYILKLTSDRYRVFESYGNRRFAQPVPDFKHSRQKPLICFIINDSGEITHFGFGRKGINAGTGLIRLNINDIVKIGASIHLKEIVEQSGNRFRHNLEYQIKIGGLITPKSFLEFLRVFLLIYPKAKPILNKFSDERQIRIAKLNPQQKKSLAEQKDAVLTAMNIAGMDKHQIRGWDYPDNGKPTSFLDGLESVTLREDSMIINDLHNLPGFDLIKQTKFSSAIFKNNSSQLTILLANRMPLEELLGTDLIYFNETFHCFVMVQYKVMEKEDKEFVFRLPNDQLIEEISRMESIRSMLNSKANSDSINDFRLDLDPFFIKFCPRLDFEPDDAGLSHGMYLPLRYFYLLQNDNSIKGIRGGKSISYLNVGRYLNNTSFKTIIEGAWLGTNSKQSEILSQMIRLTIENGKSIVYAIKRSLTKTEILEQIEDFYNYNYLDDIDDIDLKE